ncbi:MAG: amidohydrolase [Actinobacteria bacterium]|nr:amidohydrolase [Actinomycetota bacterium]
MRVVDAQLHEPPISLGWEEAGEALRWDILLEVQLAYMDAVGVDRAVLHPLDLAWGEYAVERYPKRFMVVPMVGSAAAEQGSIDPRAVPIEDFVSEKSKQPGLAGIRIVRSEGPDWLDEFGPAIAACAQSKLPLFVYTTGDLAAPATIAEQNPHLAVIIDHLGLPRGLRRDDPPFRQLPELLNLAKYDNIAVKLSGAPTLSTRTYPYEDLWPHLDLIVDTFGPQRLMWGTDISRIMGSVGFHYSASQARHHTYAEALLYLREAKSLSPTAKRWILGDTAASLLRWPSD